MINSSGLCPIYKEIMHFHYLTYFLEKEIQPGDHEIYSFDRPFLVHHYYIFSLSDICTVVEKNIFQEIVYFKHMNYLAMP